MLQEVGVSCERSSSRVDQDDGRSRHERRQRAKIGEPVAACASSTVDAGSNMSAQTPSTLNADSNNYDIYEEKGELGRLLKGNSDTASLTDTSDDD